MRSGRGRSAVGIAPMGGGPAPMPTEVTAQAQVQVQVQEEPPVVFGIPFDNAHPESQAAMEVTKKVVAICIVFFAIAVINALRTAYDGSYTKALGELFWSSIVPACGYFGAKQKDRSLLITFWCCNVLSAVLTAVVLMLYIFTVLTVRDNLSCCDSDAKHPCTWDVRTCSNATVFAAPAYVNTNSQGASSRYGSQYGSRSNTGYYSSAYRGQSRQRTYTISPAQKRMHCDCDYWTTFNTRFISTLSDDNFYILILGYIFEFTLALAAVVWAKRLHDCPYFNPSRGNNNNPPVRTELRTVQAIPVQAVAVQAAPVHVMAMPVTATSVAMSASPGTDNPVYGATVEQPPVYGGAPVAVVCTAVQN